MTRKDTEKSNFASHSQFDEFDKNSTCQRKKDGENVSSAPKLDKPFYQIRTSNRFKHTPTRNYSRR